MLPKRFGPYSSDLRKQRKINFSETDHIYKDKHNEFCQSFFIDKRKV